MHQRRTTTKIKQPCRIGMNGTGGNHDVALHKNNNDNPASCTTNGNDGSSIVSTTTLGTTTATTNTTTISYGNSISTSTNCNNNNVSSNSNRRKRVKRGRRIQSSSTNFEFSIHRLLLPLIIIFCILWIRMFYMIGSSRRSLVLPPPVLLSNNTNNENHDDAIQAQNNNNNHDRRRQQQEEARSILISQSKSNSKIDSSSSSSSSSKFQLISNQAPSCNNTLSSSSEEEIDITLVTQLSQDRLWMMKYHCERYGPNSISIAVYTNKTLEEVQTELVEMGCRVQQATTDDDDDAGNSHGNDNGSKSKDDDDDDEKNMEIDNDDPTKGKTAEEGATTTTTAAIVSVVVLNAERHGTTAAWNDYPVNELRNLALRAVRTTHILYIDIDFWTSANLYDTIVHNPQIKQQLYQDPKLVLVIPAFQLQRISNCTDETIDCRQEHVTLMPHKVKGLSEGIKNKRITIFDPTNRGGHGSTDYTKWFQQPSGNLHKIDCLKSHRYEPFVVIRYCREITPPFQSIFSGYGKNKMTWMMQVIRSGFVFAQLGGVYVIHYPHPLSSSRMNWNTAPKQLQQQQQHQNYNVRRPKQSDGDTINFQNYKRGQTDLLYLEFKNWLEETIPSTNIRVPMCHTAQDDDNKLWIDPKLKKWK